MHKNSSFWGTNWFDTRNFQSIHIALNQKLSFVSQVNSVDLTSARKNVSDRRWKLYLVISFYHIFKEKKGMKRSFLKLKKTAPDIALISECVILRLSFGLCMIEWVSVCFCSMFHSLICSIHNFNCLVFFLLFIHQYVPLLTILFLRRFIYMWIVWVNAVLGSNHTWYSFRHFFRCFFFFSSSFDWFISHLSFLNWRWCTQLYKNISS